MSPISAKWWVVLLGTIVLVPVASGQCVVNESQTLNALFGSPADDFGSALHADDDVAIVAAPGDDDRAVDAGAAYVFRHDGVKWRLEQKLVAPDGAALDDFGSSVHVSGSVLIVGAGKADGNAADTGAAYVFRHDGATWQFEQKLVADDGVPGDRFGAGVAIHGDDVVVGAPDVDEFSLDRGATYFFRYNGATWIQTQRELPLGSGGRMGVAVDLEAGLAAIGAEVDASFEGAVHVYRSTAPGSWTLEQTLTGGTGSPGALFGASVSLDGRFLGIGAPADDDAGFNAGAAYVFRYRTASGTWNEQAKLTSNDTLANDTFGTSVALSSDALLVGAPERDAPAPNAGRTYVFRRNGNQWSESLSLQRLDATSEDQLGRAVALSANGALTGVRADDPVADVGSVLVFDVDRLIFQATPPIVPPAANLTLRTCQAEPATPVVLGAVAINGTPTFLVVHLGIANSDGVESVSGSVPPVLSGTTIDFQSFARFWDDGPEASDVATVSFL